MAALDEAESVLSLERWPNLADRGDADIGADDGGCSSWGGRCGLPLGLVPVANSAGSFGPGLCLRGPSPSICFNTDRWFESEFMRVSLRGGI